MESYKFGDIIKYREKEYVFLVQTPEITYAAVILDKENTAKFESLYNHKARGSHQEKSDRKIAYCYVILNYTEDYKGRAAHFARSQQAASDFVFEKIGILDTKDKIAIKDDIVSPGSAVYLELKELIEKIDIQ
jgi:hypothetical protein